MPSATRAVLRCNAAPTPGSNWSRCASSNRTPNIGAGSIHAGYTTGGAGYSLQGTLAGLGWYNRVLSPTEISHNYTVLKAALQRRGIVLP